MKTRLFKPFVALLAAAVVIPSVAQAQTVDLGSSANRFNRVKTVPVQKLSNRVERLIRVVEGSTLPCETRSLVVERLRLLDDALLSGRRSAARALVQAWRQDAWSMEAARVIGPQLGGALQTQLSGLPDEIGYGWSDKPGPTRNWKPLAACGSGATGVGATSAHVVGDYNPPIADPTSALKIFIQTALAMIPEVGPALFGMVDLLWPEENGNNNEFEALVDQATYDQVSTWVASLQTALADPDLGWEHYVSAWKTHCDDPSSYDCAHYADTTLWKQWDDDVQSFRDASSHFQEAGSQVLLLPLYAQYENLYLGFLRDGIMLHDKYWKDWENVPNVTEQPDPEDVARTSMHTQLTDPSHGIGYVNYWYKQGLDEKSGWDARNAYIRNMTLEVLDFRDTWKYMDPDAYPNGVPGGVKLTRMIYSDRVGTFQGTPHFPSNVSGPLKETSVYATLAQENLIDSLWIDAVQATSPPLMGPAQSGAITGDTSKPKNRTHYYNLSALGPINEVSAEMERITQAHPSYTPNWIQYTFATGAQYSTGDFVSETECNPNLIGTQACVSTFQYPDEVLATVQASGVYDGRDSSVVFGFRYADSFDPSGQLFSHRSAGGCLDAPSWISGRQVQLVNCGQPATPDQIWTYDPGLQQISVTDPAGWNDNETTDSGKYCLDTADGGTAAYTPVVLNACDDGAVTYDANGNQVVSSQRWTIEAVGPGIGKITNVKSGLVLEVYPDGATLLLRLNSYNPYDSWQQWQVHNPLTGEIHGIGSGRCVDVPNFSTYPGTQVQLYDCTGSGAQQWTYNPSTKELIYARAPSLCLEALGGGTTDGTPVQTNTCNDNPEQQWTLQGISERTGAVVSGGVGMITNVKSGLVLDAKNGAVANGTPLQLYHNNGTEAQSWSRTSSQGGAVYAAVAGKCLTAGDTGIVIQTCTDPMSATQTWVYHTVAQTYTIETSTGLKCLDASGTTLTINDCTGAASQQWSRDPSYSIITNVASGLALEVNGGGTANGTPVILGILPMTTDEVPVPAPTPAQKWVWSLN